MGHAHRNDSIAVTTPESRCVSRRWNKTMAKSCSLSLIKVAACETRRTAAAPGAYKRSTAVVAYLCLALQQRLHWLLRWVARRLRTTHFRRSEVACHRCHLKITRRVPVATMSSLGCIVRGWCACASVWPCVEALAVAHAQEAGVVAVRMGTWHLRTGATLQCIAVGGRCCLPLRKPAETDQNFEPH